MKFELWDTLFNLVIVAFWYQIWRAEDRTDAYNPYLHAINRPARSGIEFFRNALPAFTTRMWAVLLILMALVFRALAAQNSDWQLTFGFVVGAQPERGVLAHLQFSLLSFAIFLFKLWGLTLIYTRAEKDIYSEHTHSCIFLISTPFTILASKWRPLVLYGVGIVLAALLLQWDAGQTEALGARAVIANAMISSLAAWIDLLALLAQLVVFLIIGSWITLITGSGEMGYFCRSWMDFILGPMRRFPLVIGPLDLTPIVFMVVTLAIYSMLRVFLYGQLLALLNQ